MYFAIEEEIKNRYIVVTQNSNLNHIFLQVHNYNFFLFFFAVALPDFTMVKRKGFFYMFNLLTLTKKTNNNCVFFFKKKTQNGISFIFYKICC